MNGDVVGVIEMENQDENDITPALLDLVNGLNAAMGAGTYAFIDDDLNNDGIQDGNTDLIRCGIIYKPAVVTPVGTAMLSTDPIFERPPLAQTFNLISTNKKFNFIVNHFKSKGCGGAVGADLDQLDGQSCFNSRRKFQATALVNFINTVVIPTSGANPVISVGDYNSYYEEDPMDILRATGLITPANSSEYSFLFSGQLGTLDHAVINPSLFGTITSLAKWNINSVEPSYLDYEDGVNDGGGDVVNPWFATYTVSPWRSSDHDPILMSLNLDITLPLTLNSFTAVKVNTSSKLVWETSSEINIREFVAERSSDGINWIPIATVPSAGNNSPSAVYSIFDNSPAKGINLYRIKIVSADGHFEYTPIRRVDFNNKYLFSIYPNPAHEQVQLSTDNNTGLRITVQVINSQGQTVLDKKINSQQATANINVSTLVPGVYFIKIQTEDGNINMLRFIRQ